MIFVSEKLHRLCFRYLVHEDASRERTIRKLGRGRGVKTETRGQRLVSQKPFSRRGGRDDYGQLRYTHSVSPYRSIATGGSHFLANGCFHPPANAPSFPLTLSFHDRSFFLLRLPPFSRFSLSREISILHYPS